LFGWHAYGQKRLPPLRVAHRKGQVHAYSPPVSTRRIPMRPLLRRFSFVTAGTDRRLYSILVVRCTVLPPSRTAGVATWSVGAARLPGDVCTAVRCVVGRTSFEPSNRTSPQAAQGQCRAPVLSHDPAGRSPPEVRMALTHHDACRWGPARLGAARAAGSQRRPWGPRSSLFRRPAAVPVSDPGSSRKGDLPLSGTGLQPAGERKPRAVKPGGRRGSFSEGRAAHPAQLARTLALHGAMGSARAAAGPADRHESLGARATQVESLKLDRVCQ
jgi:hypothetical protein